MNPIFLTLASQHFAFLETEYALRKIRTRANYIRWHNSEVFVELYYDSQRSFELEARVGLCNVLFNGNEVPFDLDLIARKDRLTRTGRVINASTEALLDRGLAEMANVMKTAGKPYLLADLQAYHILEQHREKEGDELERAGALRQMRREVDPAWKKKDFRKVVDLYKDHLEWLTRSELKRYEIALKRLTPEPRA